MATAEFSVEEGITTVGELIEVLERFPMSMHFRCNGADSPVTVTRHKSEDGSWLSILAEDEVDLMEASEEPDDESYEDDGLDEAPTLRELEARDDAGDEDEESGSIFALAKALGLDFGDL